MYISKLADNDKYFMIWQVCYKVGPDNISVCEKITSDELMVYDAPIVPGEKGDKGDKGATGATGPKGKDFWGK
jgi:hypothetical protein